MVVQIQQLPMLLVMDGGGRGSAEGGRCLMSSSRPAGQRMTSDDGPCRGSFSSHDECALFLLVLHDYCLSSSTLSFFAALNRILYSLNSTKCDCQVCSSIETLDIIRRCCSALIIDLCADLAAVALV